MKKIFKILLLLIIAAAAVLATVAGYQKYVSPPRAIEFKTEPVARGSLMNTISASGTVEPEELVSVGAQVSGKIMSFGKDTDGKIIDYGSRVKAGMLLAQIDDTVYEAEVQDGKAAKQQAEAAILSAQAEIKAAKAKSVLADRNWSRARELQPKGAMARSDYDSAEADYLSAHANIAVAQAALAQAKAQLAAAKAALFKAERNLSYCVISSPVDGVIIDRRVSIGQTVVSSMSVSTIFLIAKDLKRMQVWVSVNEADIGDIKPGMPVVFTVDAFPNRQFKGTVHKVRLNATMSQNVVTYVVEVVTDNSSGRLLPYLTANVRFIKAQRKDVPTVSNAALRFVPEIALVTESSRPDYTKLIALRNAPGNERVVWVENGAGLLRPSRVKIGLSSGTQTELLESSLKEGDRVVNGVLEGKAAVANKKSSGGSPFLPTPPKRQNRRNQRPPQ